MPTFYLCLMPEVEFVLRALAKVAIFAPMHFSKHITESHSTFSLLAALKLRVAR